MPRIDGVTDCADNPIMDSRVIGMGKQDDVRESGRRQVEQLAPFFEPLLPAKTKIAFAGRMPSMS